LSEIKFVSYVAVFVRKRDVKLLPTNRQKISKLPSNEVHLTDACHNIYLAASPAVSVLTQYFFVGLGPKFLDSGSQPFLHGSPRYLPANLVWFKP